MYTLGLALGLPAARIMLGEAPGAEGVTVANATCGTETTVLMIVAVLEPGMTRPAEMPVE